MEHHQQAIALLRQASKLLESGGAPGTAARVTDIANRLETKAAATAQVEAERHLDPDTPVDLDNEPFVDE
jgi:hypothetical protein